MTAPGLPMLLQAESRVHELTWGSPVPTWVWFLVLVPAVLAFAAYVYRREDAERGAGADARIRRPLRWTLTGLRVLVILIVMALLAQPILRTTESQDVESTVILLVDDSLSMDIADKYSDREMVQKIADFLRSTPETVESTRRYDLVRRLLRDEEVGLLEKLREKSRVAVYAFAGGARKLRDIPRRAPGAAPLAAEGGDPLSALDPLPPYEDVRGDSRVHETRIGDALLEAVSNERGGGISTGDRHVAGVILFSDGQQTPGGRPVEDVARRMGQQRVPIPIHAVGIGNPDEPKDIRVVSLDVSNMVLAGDLVPFDAAIVSEGFKGERVRVDLKLDEDVVATQYVVLEGEGRRQPVRLEHRPPKPGDYVATVEVERRGGEIFEENNAASRDIRVLDQKIRVLYAEGQPRWEYRYLKNALIRDPTMQAQVFLFSADPSFTQESSPGVPDLKELPKRREDLFAYHVIVLGDVDVERRLTPEQVSLLKEFVYEAGGGLVFIAGDAANPWKYIHTDLYGLIPVEVPERSPISLGADGSPKTAPFNVELTPVGREHAVLRLDNDAERNAKLWENRDGLAQEHLPGLLSFHDVGRAKKGAVVLARHPTRTDPVEGNGLVVFAFMNYGKGRTFFSAVDDTWRWRAGVDNLYFYRFWGQVIRFAATGRLLGKTPRFSITTDKVSYTLGETIGIECRVFDANMKPSTEKTLTVYHVAKAGEAKAPDSIELELDPIQGQGSYHGGLVASRLGLHEVWIGTETEPAASRTFEVTVPALEFRDPRRNRAVLDEVASLSGGSFIEIQDIGGLAGKLDVASRTREGKVEDDPLWDDLRLVLLVVALLAGEWILRKVVHLL
ncbi:MAG: VWA domain-containing protein [Planctomycetes bacterium]|nr:VWA domain-containing protein [Planctomycetota bacterium]